MFPLRVSWVLALLFGAAAAQQQAAPTVQERLGYPANSRLLIIHADDVGMAHSVNRASFQALENGWISSASVMVSCPWFPEVVLWARAHPDADLGLHLVLTSEWTDFRWGPVAPSDRVASLLDPDGYLFQDTPLLQQVKPSDAAVELRAQIERARAAGIRFSHLDSHMIALQTSVALFPVYRQVGRDYNVPILAARRGDYAPPPNTVPDSEFLVDEVIEMRPGVAAKDWLKYYEDRLSPLKPGVYQLLVHLAYDDEEMRGVTRDHPDWGASWRQSDLDVVASPEFKRFLRDRGFILIKWSDLARAASVIR